MMFADVPWLPTSQAHACVCVCVACELSCCTLYRPVCEAGGCGQPGDVGELVDQRHWRPVGLSRQAKVGMCVGVVGEMIYGRSWGTLSSTLS